MNTLKQAVITQLGYESDTEQELIEVCQDISNYGIGGGFGQFVYYHDTIQFFDNNKVEILALCQEMADSLGEDMLTMIAGFNCLKSHKLTPTEVMDGIYEPDSEWESQVKNALVWFAAEEIARNISEQ